MNAKKLKKKGKGKAQAAAAVDDVVRAQRLFPLRLLVYTLLCYDLCDTPAPPKLMYTTTTTWVLAV